MKKTIAAGVLALSLAACGTTQTEWPEQDENGHYACYYADGKFARYDDDADCDKSDNVKPPLYRKQSIPAPVKTSSGLKTASVPKPTAKAPLPRSTRK